MIIFKKNIQLVQYFYYENGFVNFYSNHFPNLFFSKVRNFFIVLHDKYLKLKI